MCEIIFYRLELGLLFPPPPPSLSSLISLKHLYIYRVIITLRVRGSQSKILICDKFDIQRYTNKILGKSTSYMAQLAN